MLDGRPSCPSSSTNSLSSSTNSLRHRSPNCYMEQYAFITVTCPTQYEIFYFCRRFEFRVCQSYKCRQTITSEFTLTVAALNKLTDQHCSIRRLLRKVSYRGRGEHLTKPSNSVHMPTAVRSSDLFYRSDHSKRRSSMWFLHFRLSIHSTLRIS